MTPVMAILAVGAAALALFAIPAGDDVWTYRQASGAAQLLGIAAGVAVAVSATFSRGLQRVLLLAMAAVWFAQDLEALGDSGAALRSLASGAAPFAAALALHLAVSFARPRPSRAARFAVGGAYLAAAATAVGTVALRDPFRDVYCWRQCSSNPLLLHSAPALAHAFVVAGWLVAIAAGVAALAVVVWRIARASHVGRAAIAPVLAAVAAVAIAEAGRGVALLAVPLEDPRRTGFAAIYLARAAALVALAAGVAWTVLRRRVIRARVRKLAADLGAAATPGALRERLAAALGDPGVEVLYWAPAVASFATEEGLTRELPPLPATRIMRGERLLAVVVYEVAALPARDLDRLLGPAARLAIENAALRAEVLAQLRQLRQSRARIVATADESRRRLERDLHDGAQQRLLAVVLDLRLARGGADRELAERLQHIGYEVDRAFNELRELAHGIYPAVLTEAGLEAALPTLADVAPLTVQLHDVTAERFPAPVEAGAYVAVDEAIRDAAARGAGAMRLTVVVRDRRLVITADDDGTPRVASLVHVADRIGALGGRLDLMPTNLRAEIPCA
jgi:signal transduction histidine kinase